MEAMDYVLCLEGAGASDESVQLAEVPRQAGQRRVSRRNGYHHTGTSELALPRTRKDPLFNHCRRTGRSCQCSMPCFPVTSVFVRSRRSRIMRLVRSGFQHEPCVLTALVDFSSELVNGTRP